MQMNCNVIPMTQASDDGRMRGCVGSLKVRHSLVREHDAPTERIRRPIALVDLDTRVRQRLLQQNGCVKPGRTPAHADYALHMRSGVTVIGLDVKHFSAPCLLGVPTNSRREPCTPMTATPG